MYFHAIKSIVVCKYYLKNYLKKSKDNLSTSLSHFLLYFSSFFSLLLGYSQKTVNKFILTKIYIIIL